MISKGANIPREYEEKYSNYLNNIKIIKEIDYNEYLLEELLGY